jgi:hypothetical protein
MADKDRARVSISVLMAVFACARTRTIAVFSTIFGVDCAYKCTSPQRER